MSAPIGKDDWVEYVGAPKGWVNNDGSPIGTNPTYTLGEVLRVTEVGRRCIDGSGTIWDALRHVGQPTVNGKLTSSPVEAFRPIYRPDPNLIEALKGEPVPAPEEPKRQTPVTQDMDGRGLVWTGDGAPRAFANIDEAWAFVRQSAAPRAETSMGSAA